MSKLLKMSYSDKLAVLSRDDWVRLLESKEIGRTSMNKLIMNYLVTGTISKMAFSMSDIYLLRGF